MPKSQAEMLALEFITCQNAVAFGFGFGQISQVKASTRGVLDASLGVQDQMEAQRLMSVPMTEEAWAAWIKCPRGGRAEN
jgi:hypothetical protein